LADLCKLKFDAVLLTGGAVIDFFVSWSIGRTRVLERIVWDMDRVRALGCDAIEVGGAACRYVGGCFVLCGG